jgi:hypothetical protein
MCPEQQVAVAALPQLVDSTKPHITFCKLKLKPTGFYLFLYSQY